MNICSNCQRLLRPQGAAAADYPGTVGLAARGMCGTCYRKRSHLNPTPNPSPRKKAEPKPVVEKGPSGETRCVLVRVDLTPSTYRTLKSKGVNTSLVLSQLADKLALEVSRV